MKAPSDGGAMLGGAKKVVWHSTENDPTKASATSVASFLQRSGNNVHIVWNPVSGEIVQTIPANRAGKGLKNAAGGVQTNRGGTYVVQIEVVAQATKPFTDGPCKNLDKILSWLDSLGIPAIWPAGQPKAYPASYGGTRSTSAWNLSGHFSHGQVPENVHGDPGAVNIKKLTAYGVVSHDVVKPTPVATHPAFPGHVLSTADVKTKRSDVVTWQTQMRKRGYGIPIDGYFGAKSETFAKELQRHLGLVQDGKVGKTTWDATWTRT